MLRVTDRRGVGRVGGCGRLRGRHGRPRTIAASRQNAYHRGPVTPSATQWPPTSEEDWRAQALRELRGAALDRLFPRRSDGLAISPLHPATPHQRPERSLLVAHRGWQLGHEYDLPNPSDCAAAIASDLQSGVESVWLRLDERLACGLRDGPPPPPGRHGVAITDADALAQILAPIDLATTPVTLAVGACGPEFRDFLCTVTKSKGVATTALRGAIACDPLAAWATRGDLAWPITKALADIGHVAGWAAEAAPNLRCAVVDVGTYDDAGATASDQLAMLLATGLCYLRALQAHVPLATACRQLGFAMTVGRELVVEVAKLRAARLCWARIVATLGGDAAAQTMHLHARGAWRERTRFDPWVGLLRGTGETFAAVLGGADEIATTAMDLALGTSSELGRRMARNTQLLLREEAYFGRVADPLGGAGAIESTTDQLARAAWVRLQEIEQLGGIVAALQAGLPQRWARANADTGAHAVARLRTAIVGVNRFPALVERPTGASPAPDLLATREPVAPVAAILPLHRTRLAEPFEALRATPAAAPVALLALGQPQDWRARVDYCLALLPVAGISSIVTAGSEDIETVVSQFVATAAQVAVVCSSDAIYLSTLPTLVPRLRDAGARFIVLAGGSATEVDLILRAGDDVLASLSLLRRNLGASP